MIPKPPYGSPCNGCGQCCAQAPCPLGEFVFGVNFGKCPALIDRGDIARCGLVVEPEKHAPQRTALVGREELSKAAALLIGAGSGCDARAWGELPNPEFSSKLFADSQLHWDEAVRAKRIWGVE